MLLLSSLHLESFRFLSFAHQLPELLLVHVESMTREYVSHLRCIEALVNLALGPFGEKLEIIVNSLVALFG